MSISVLTKFVNTIIIAKSNYGWEPCFIPFGTVRLIDGAHANGWVWRRKTRGNLQYKAMSYEEVNEAIIQHW